MWLQQLTFVGPPVDEPSMLDVLPEDLRKLLAQVNGFIQFNGGLHVRGVCQTPAWHSLFEAWMGAEAFHSRYAAVSRQDIPFAQDSVGDQFLLRNGSVIKLFAETGEIEEQKLPLMAFLALVQSKPVETLSLEPLIQFRTEGNMLQPGELLNVYPPFCAVESESGVSLAAVPAFQRQRFLADLSAQLTHVPNGEAIQIEIAD
jgi:hypothetical protein